ncbi:MAG: hypothetical protein VZQ95_03145, partial [Erysipelotrichaceae bacterium]|nr:hypothetical protein [Erysipelotrichaceae bacterium]
MKNMNKKTLVGLIITFLALLGSLFVLINAGVIKLPEKKDDTPAEEVVVVEPDENEKKKEEYRKLYDENKAINEDYVGQIIFDSGLVDLPFVQAKSTIREDGEPYRFFAADGTLVEDPYAYNGNDVYIWTSWKTGEYDRYEEGGSVFMDYRNYLKDQNIILYGHHF